MVCQSRSILSGTSRFLLKVRHDEQNAIDEAVAGAFAFRQLTKYLLLDGSDY